MWFLNYANSHKICQTSYLLQEDPLGLDSCWASSRIFSMSPLWMEEDEGTCSSPPTRLSSSSFCTACRGCGGSVSPWFLLATEAARLVISCCLPDAMFPFNSNSTQDPEEPIRLSDVMEPLTLKLTRFSMRNRIMPGWLELRYNLEAISLFYCGFMVLMNLDWFIRSSSKKVQLP